MSAVPHAFGPALPDPLAGLTLLDELGHGSASIVHRARRGPSEFAVKVLRDRPERPTDRAVYQREAAVLANVRHPALVRIHAVGELDGRPALVMDLVPGETLQALLSRMGPLDEPTAVRIARDAAGALAAAHATGLVHRDVKPANLIVQPDGHAKLIDFGLVARAGTQQSRDVTIGTVRYSPPEQTGLLGRAIDGRSDLYSLGVVLFEMIAGRAPFDAGDVGELARLHAAVVPPNLRDLAPGTSPALAAVAARLLAKDPDDRYQTADGLLYDLDRIASEPGGSAEFALATQDDPRANVHDLPLVGREDELATLRGAWHRAQRGHGSAALVIGAPGTGKRRLLRAVVAEAVADGALDFTARALPDDPTPLSPLREAVDRYLAGISTLAPEARARALRDVRAALESAGDDAIALSPRLAALVGGERSIVSATNSDQHAAAVARFFLELATRHGGAILRLIDVPHLDETTLRVLSQISIDLAETPLLLLATGRSDAEATAARDGFERAVAGRLHTHLELGPLTERESGTLIRSLLGGTLPDPELVAQLHHRATGNPFALQEYVRAITHAGLVRPSWGTLLVDRTGLDRLALPDDVMGLVLARLERLSPAARQFLTVAAIAGNRFSPAVVARAAELSSVDAAEACTEALAERLVERRDTDRCAFVHERLREALLAPLDGDAQAALHLRLAGVLAERSAPASAPAELAFAVAHHLAQAERPDTAERRLAWNRRAATVAVERHAAQRATELFVAAERAAQELGDELTPTDHEAWATALLRVGDVTGAECHIDAVLRASTDGRQRARVLLHRSQTLFSTYDAPGAQAAVDDGLAALGRTIPRGRLRRVMGTIVAAIVGLLMLATRRGLGSAPDDERDDLALEVDLLRAAAQVAYIRMQPLEVAACTLRALPRAARLGASRQLVQVTAAASVVVASLGAHRVRARLIDGALRTARAIRDPSALAYASLYRVLSLEAAGQTREAGDAADGLLAEHGRWLETADLLLGVGAIAFNLDLRGHVREALREWQSVHDRVLHASQSGADENPYLLMGWISMETLGERAEAARLRQAVRALDKPEGDNPYRRQMYLGALIRYLREQNEYGPELRDAIAASDALQLDPRTANPWVQGNFTQPFAVEVALAERASDPQERARHLAEARRRWRRVRQVHCGPLHAADNLAVLANLEHLAGHTKRAERLLARAERLAVRADHLRAHCEIARIRARIAREAGHPAEARRQAHIALRLAADHGWRAVLEQLRRDLGVAPGVVVVGSSGAGSGATLTGGSTSDGESLSASVTAMGRGGSLRGRRTLDTLLELSLAASHTHDPAELARISLDHVVGLLGAERGFLFLADDDSGELELSAVRDASGEAVDAAQVGWSRTVVDHVVRTRQPLVITGSDEALAIGAESAVQHGLRSILACPLLLEGRLLGVLQVDSRLARGIFGEGDSDILSAMGSHIAVALETTRATQLELAVATEREQRGLAEALRDAMSEISATLDPVEVLERTLECAWPLIRYDRAAVLLRDHAGRWSVPAVAGDLEHDAAVEALATESGSPFLEALCARSTPEVHSQVIIGGSPAERVLGPAGAWLAVPLVARGEHSGVLLMATDEPGHLGDAQLDVAATFAAQGLIAHENARLFKAVERMATTDELTQVHNRRHFFELGENQFLTAQRYELPLATLMLDIDHFKHVNDTYGHAAGDDVIREVARRLQGLIRTVDIVGRYGGEEFAFVLPCTGDDATILAERLRAAVEATPIHTCEGDLPLTVSIGVAVYDRQDAHLAAMLGRADLALYEAKRAGRNLVRVAATTST